MKGFMIFLLQAAADLSSAMVSHFRLSMPDEEELYNRHKAPLRPVNAFCCARVTPAWLHTFKNHPQVLLVLGLTNRAITRQLPGMAKIFKKT